MVCPVAAEPALGTSPGAGTRPGSSSGVQGSLHDVLGGWCDSHGP